MANSWGNSLQTWAGPGQVATLVVSKVDCAKSDVLLQTPGLVIWGPRCPPVSLNQSGPSSLTFHNCYRPQN